MSVSALSRVSATTEPGAKSRTAKNLPPCAIAKPDNLLSTIRNRLDWLVDGDVQASPPKQPGAVRQDVARAAQADGHDGAPTFNGDSERAGLERQWLAVSVNRAFRKHHDRHALPECLAHRERARVASGQARPVDDEMTDFADGQPDERPRQRAVVDHKSIVDRDGGHQNDRIEVTGVIGDEHRRAATQQMLETPDPKPACAQSNHETGAPFQQAVRKPALWQDRQCDPQRRKCQEQQSPDIRSEESRRRGPRLHCQQRSAAAVQEGSAHS